MAIGVSAPLLDNVHDRAARRPDEQFAEVVLGSVGVYLDGLVECDAVYAEISVSCGDRTRYLAAKSQREVYESEVSREQKS